MAGTSGERVDPRVARTRRDVIKASSRLLLEGGWSAMTHAEVARRAGYSKATVYAHWPTPLDLMQDAVDQICDDIVNPAATTAARRSEDLLGCLRGFAEILSEGQFDLLLAGIVEHGGRDRSTRNLGRRLYEAGTQGIRRILEVHLDPNEAELALTMLVGAVVVRATYEGTPVTDDFIRKVVDRTLPVGAHAWTLGEA